MTQQYTPAQLEALLKDATPGPWRVEEETTLIWGHCNQDDNSTQGMGYPIAEAKLRTSGWNSDAIKWPTVTTNAALIAAAPDLARLVVEKEKEIARLKAAAEDLVSLCHADVKMNGTTYQPMTYRSAFTKAVERMIELINNDRQAMKETSDE